MKGIKVENVVKAAENMATAIGRTAKNIMNYTIKTKIILNHCLIKKKVRTRI